MIETTRIIRRLCGLALGGSLALAPSPSPCASEQSTSSQKDAKPTSLFITYTCKFENRAAFREYMGTAGVAQFDKWKADGVLKDYLILFESYARLNKAPWDMVVRVDFRGYADTVNWKKIERTMPGGLSSKAQALVSEVSSYLTDVVSEAGMAGDRPNAFYVVKSVKFAAPQEVGTAFVRGYVVDVMQSFVRDKVFTGYGVYLNQQVGSDLSYLTIYEYADTETFGRRTAAKNVTRSKNDVWTALRGSRVTSLDEVPAFFGDRILPH